VSSLRITVKPYKGGFLASYGRRSKWGVTADEALGALCRFYIEQGTVTLFWGTPRKVYLNVQEIEGNDGIS
jgi:hypothetical protein